MKTFKVGDHVYSEEDFISGEIVEIDGDSALVEFRTSGGGGCLPFKLSELKHEKAFKSKQKKSFEKYNTRVRQAMSEEYVKSSKKKAQLQRKCEDILESLATGKDNLSYNEYVALEEKARKIQRQYEDEQIRFDIWDQAREICLNVADEVL